MEMHYLASKPIAREGGWERKLPRANRSSKSDNCFFATPTNTAHLRAKSKSCMSQLICCLVLVLYMHALAWCACKAPQLRKQFGGYTLATRLMRGRAQVGQENYDALANRGGVTPRATPSTDERANLGDRLRY